MVFIINLLIYERKSEATIFSDTQQREEKVRGTLISGSKRCLKSTAAQKIWQVQNSVQEQSLISHVQKFI